MSREVVAADPDSPYLEIRVERDADDLFVLQAQSKDDPDEATIITLSAPEARGVAMALARLVGHRVPG